MQIIGIGNDIVETLRIARLIERHDELFLRRVFTKREIEFCSSRRSATQHYASYWAGKESILRSLGTSWSRGIQWTDMEISTESGGRNLVQLSGPTLDWAKDCGVDEIQLSVSFCRTHASATAIAIAWDETES